MLSWLATNGNDQHASSIFHFLLKKDRVNVSYFMPVSLFCYLLSPFLLNSLSRIKKLGTHKEMKGRRWKGGSFMRMRQAYMLTTWHEELEHSQVTLFSKLFMDSETDQFPFPLHGPSLKSQSFFPSFLPISSSAFTAFRTHDQMPCNKPSAASSNRFELYM